MSNKKETNKVIILVIAGLILAWFVGGLMGGFIGNIFFGIAIMAVIFSGVFGRKALETIGGFGIPFTIATIIATNSWDKWWLYILGYLIAIFIANALSNFRPNAKRESLEYDTELKYLFTSKDDAFSIMFPKKPRVVDEAQARYYVFNNNKNTGLVVTVQDVLWYNIKTQQDIAAQLKTWVQETTKADDMTHVVKPDFRSIRVDGSLAAVTVRTNSNRSTIRYDAVTIKDNKLYDITLNSTVENIELFTKFLKNFKFSSVG